VTTTSATAYRSAPEKSAGDRHALSWDSALAAPQRLRARRPRPQGCARSVCATTRLRRAGEGRAPNGAGRVPVGEPEPVELVVTRCVRWCVKHARNAAVKKAPLPPARTTASFPPELESPSAFARSTPPHRTSTPSVRWTTVDVPAGDIRLSHQLTGRVRSHRQSGSRSGFATPRPAPRWRRWARIVGAQVTLPPCVRPPLCGAASSHHRCSRPNLRGEAPAPGHGGVPKLRPSRAPQPHHLPADRDQSPRSCRGSRTLRRATRVPEPRP
jgi:hypothetical protein